MKKLVILLLTGGISLCANAQSNKELHLGIGTGSIQEVAVRNGTHPLFDVALSSSEPIKTIYSTAGPIRFGIKKHESKNFLLGAEFNYTNVEVMNDYGAKGNEFINFIQYTLMASTQYKFIDKPMVTAYTGVDFGVSFSTAKNQESGRKINDLTGAFQLNFMGIRYGQKMGLFAEVGIGFNGFLSGGLFYRID